MSTLNSVYGIWCYLTGMDIIHPLSSTRPTYEDTLRAQGTFNNPLTFAEYLLIILCLSVALIFSTEIKKLKFFFILSIFIIGFGILFSYTRSSWLGLFGAMIFISIIIGRKAYISIAIFLLLIGSISCSLDNTLIKRAKSIFEYSEQSQNVRLSIWCITLWMIKDYPVVGVGEGNYKKIFGEYKDELGINTKIWGEAHNTFLHVLATRGIIGLLAFLWLWIVFFKESILGYINIRDSFLRFLLLGALAGMIGIHIAGLFEHVFGDSEVAMLIWFIMGLVMSIIIHHKDKYYVLSTEDSQNKKLRL
jgi:O-antigen ligase